MKHEGGWDKRRHALLLTHTLMDSWLLPAFHTVTVDLIVYLALFIPARFSLLCFFIVSVFRSRE